MVVYLIYIWSILHPFGRCGHLVFLLPFGVVYPVLVYFMYKEKSGNPGCRSCVREPSDKEGGMFFFKKKS
jgi:hypothetical protein